MTALPHVVLGSASFDREPVRYVYWNWGKIPTTDRDYDAITSFADRYLVSIHEGPAHERIWPVPSYLGEQLHG